MIVKFVKYKFCFRKLLYFIQCFPPKIASQSVWMEFPSLNGCFWSISITNLYLIKILRKVDVQQTNRSSVCLVKHRKFSLDVFSFFLVSLSQLQYKAIHLLVNIRVKGNLAPHRLGLLVWAVGRSLLRT